MPKIRSRGRSAAVIPADRPVDARLKRPSRGHFSHTCSAVASAKATCCSRERRFHRRVVWADGNDAFLSVPRPTHGRGSVRPIRCRGAPYDDEPGARGVNITLTCRRTRPSAQKSGCPIAGWCGTMGPMPHIRSADRLAAGNSENCLPRAPGWGVGSVNKVFTATYQLITVD